MLSSHAASKREAVASQLQAIAAGLEARNPAYIGQRCDPEWVDILARTFAAFIAMFRTQVANRDDWPEVSAGFLEGALEHVRGANTGRTCEVFAGRIEGVLALLQQPYPPAAFRPA